MVSLLGDVRDEVRLLGRVPLLRLVARVAAPSQVLARLVSGGLQQPEIYAIISTTVIYFTTYVC